MKKAIMSSLLIFATIGLYSQIKIISNGNVGINVPNPVYKIQTEGSLCFGQWGPSSTWEKVILDWTSNQWGAPMLYPNVDGQLSIGKDNNRVGVHATQVWAVTFTNTSDERVKEGITNLDSSLEKLKLLRGVSYSIKPSYIKNLPTKTKSDLSRKNIGFIAQEVEKVFPELITKSDSEEIYGVNYVALIPVLVDAINRQQARIEVLEKNASKKASTKSASEATEEKTAISGVEPNTKGAVLYQNNPNPFSERTKISLYLPNEIRAAILNIYDMQGLQIRTIKISNRGAVTEEICGQGLRAGMYFYSLIADGLEVDTKRMILTD